jgi:hypothetical protein
LCQRALRGTQTDDQHHHTEGQRTVKAPPPVYREAEAVLCDYAVCAIYPRVRSPHRRVIAIGCRERQRLTGA